MKYSIIEVLSLCVMLVMGTTACSDEMPADNLAEDAQHEMPVDDYTGEVLDAGFRISLPQYASVVNAEAKTGSRSLLEDELGTVHFDYENMRDVFIHVCLQNGDDVQSRSYATLEGHIVKDASGRYSVEIPDPYIRLKKGRLTGTDWKACALLETAERTEGQRFFGTNRYSSKVNTDSYFAAGGSFLSKNLSQLTTPLYSKYAPVSTQERRVTVNLNFEPLGTIIRVNVQNTLAVPIYVNKVKIRNPAIKAGNANVVLGVEENGMLKFDFGTQASGGTGTSDGVLWPAGEVCVWNVSPARIELSDNLYLWCIPVASDYVQNQIELVYSIGPSYSASEADSVMLDKSPNPVQMKSGFYYSVNAPLKESDLMITEMLHHNPSGYNFSVIEIYNPTSHEIDIRNYGLCRIQKWDGGLPVVIGEGVNVAQPLGNALVQDLFVTDFNQPVYRYDGQLAAASYQGRNRYYDMYGTHIDKDARRYMLQPGHTVVLVAGQIRERLANAYLKEQYYWPTGSLMYNTPYLANAVKTGHCQYVAALDNGITAIDYASGANSGVMQHGFNHVMVLVKKKAGATGYEAVDWLFSACHPDLIKLLQSRALPSPNVKDDHLFISRKESVMYPVSKRDNAMYLHTSKSHLPAGEPIYDIAQTYQFYDWVYHFTEHPRDYYSRMYQYMTPGTRSFLPEVDNGRVWMTGAYNETGNSTTPNTTTGK